MSSKPKIQREYFSIKELSEYTGISDRKLRNMLNKTANPMLAYRFDGSIKIKENGIK